jgi:uncharacterized membrane protein (UPF0182 family)
MRKKLLILVTVLAVLAGIVAGLATFYTEYLWFDHLGFSSVYITVLLAQLGTGVAFGLVCFLALGLHILLIRKFSKPRQDWTISTPDGQMMDVADLVRKVSTPVVVAAALLVSAIMGYWASRHWEDVLKFLNQTSFGQAEPILNKDIGFYLFALPTMQFVQEWLVYLTGLCLVLSAVVYFLRNAVSFKERKVECSDAVRGHLLFGLASILVVIAWGWRIEMFETLFSKRGVAYGATYTDVHVNLVAYRIMVGVCLACAVFLLALIKVKPKGKKATLYPAVSLGVVVVLYLVGTFAWPTVVQKFVVNPSELDKERPYLVHAIAGTRKAFGLDRIVTRPFPATEDLKWEDVEQAQGTLDNIKIWDHRPLRATYKQVQVIRLYYDFPAISVDRYWADGRYRQVMLSARELVTSQLPAQSQTWLNQHLLYTHGYGVCLSPVNQVAGEGLPDLWIKDIPPQSRYEQHNVSQPGIYYGQATNEFVLVGTTTQEFDYPRGAENKYTHYKGQGGVGINTFWRRVLFTIRMADINLLFTSYLTDNSRILFNRNIQDRVRAVAPFLMLDQEPYMVVSDGRLFWIQDAYTISYRYPYSQYQSLGRRQRINYIRNSVKVVIDAYHGKLKLYVYDESDPMIRTYQKIFPDLFSDAAEMPRDLVAHVRYPKDLFTIQAKMYESFHMTDPRIWYNQEDKWDVSRELSEKAAGRAAEQSAQPGVNAQKVTSTDHMSPYYMIMRLPNEPKEEFLLMVPYTPTNKDNMVAWMAARCDGANYGKLLVYTFPKKKLIFGPMQIEARIDQDSDISQWITLRNQQGSTVIRGDLLVIPIKQSILYVEPIYLEATQTKLPELKQVIVAFGKKLTMEGDLRSALHDVFEVRGEPALAAKPTAPGAKPEPAEPGSQPAPAAAAGDVRSLAQQALKHYEDGKDRLAKGDWAGYGQQQQALKQALDRLADKLQPQLRPRKKPAAGGETE